MTNVPTDPFERLYRESGDPWGFRTSWYERRRYALTLAALPNERYERCFEPGCSIGELTAGLASRATTVVAIDPAPTAVAAAQARLAGNQGVELSVGQVPRDWPHGSFDLIVLSEIGYYFSPETLDELVRDARLSLEPGGQLVAVHWRGESADHILDGDTVHERLREHLGRPLIAYEEARFRLDVWETAV